MRRIIQYLCYTGFLQALRQYAKRLIRLFYGASRSENNPCCSGFLVLLSPRCLVSQSQPDWGLPAQQMVGFLATAQKGIPFDIRREG